MHAGDPRRRLVVADHQGIAAETGVGQHVVADDDHHQEDDHRHRHTGHPPLAEIDQVGRHAVDRPAVGDDEAKPPGGAEHAQRHDERRQTGLGHQAAVDGADRRAGGDAGQRAGPPRRTGGDDAGAAHPGQGQHRPERQIQTGGSDDEGRPDRQDADHDSRLKDVQDIDDAEEIRCQRDHGRGHDDEHDQRFEPNRQSPAVPAGARRRINQQQFSVPPGPARPERKTPPRPPA